MRRQYICSPNAFSAICHASFFLIVIHYRYLHFFVQSQIIFHCISLNTRVGVMVISKAMKLRAEESKNVLFTAFLCTVSFPVSFCVRYAIRKIPGKGERLFFTPKPPNVFGDHLTSYSFLGQRCLGVDS